ncbi:MAG: AMP-binding protein [Bacteroidales bacterium]|nr:AMP-binding protein [Bacteroidales bacterium]MDD2771330.1 AMP-binding protein [Bacteroidales bacterium]MDD3549126.1 AMP-binding protein [Bacteroidales bacterium]MDD4064156.1 AMP-binding protein [Bacteroidales bacterium]MDD4499064.1 AMP-binding protein [Bacteroidales bacterium]
MDIKYTSTGEIKLFQENLLRRELSYLDERSPFYKKMFQREGIDIRKIRTMEDLQNIPFTQKSDLQQYNEEFLCVPKDQLIDYVTTSGTLSDPATYALTDRDLDRLAYNEKVSFECAGTKPGDIVQLMTTMDKRFVAGLAYFLGIRSLGAGIIRVGNGIPELQWDTILRMKPNTIICVPSFILRLIEYAEEHGIDYRNSSVKKAVCIGENLRNQDFSLNILGKHIREKWDIQLISTYASTELGATFCECPYGKGGHHIPELVICELVDEKDRVVPMGEPGELVITNLKLEGMPLLRFRTGDLARFHYEPCECGRKTMRISPLLGRKNQMIKFKGTTLYPPSLFDVLEDIPYISCYQVILRSNALGTDDVHVKISLKENHPEIPEDICKGVKDKFRAKVRVAPEVEIIPDAELKADVYNEKVRKALKLVDQRDNNSG